MYAEGTAGFVAWYVVAWYAAASLRLALGHVPDKGLGRGGYFLWHLGLTIAQFPIAFALGFIWGLLISLAQGLPAEPDQPLIWSLAGACLGVLLGYAQAMIAWRRCLDADRSKAWAVFVFLPFGWIVPLVLAPSLPAAIETPPRGHQGNTAAARHRPF